MPATHWFVYMVRCSDETLYTGITTDLTERIAKHNSGQGAKYTRSRQPVCLVWSEIADNRSVAGKREAFIKKLSRFEKEKLITKPV